MPPSAQVTYEYGGAYVSERYRTRLRLDCRGSDIWGVPMRSVGTRQLMQLLQSWGLGFSFT